MSRPSEASHPSNTNASSKKPRRRLVASLIALAAASVIIGLAVGHFSNPTTTAATASALGGSATWQQWGISIQHPAGLTARYMGFEGAKAASDSGMVQWVWNKGGTSLTLFWVNATQDEIQPRFPEVYNLLRTYTKNVALVEGGNVTMGVATWEYQTYRSTIQGETFYSTVALSYYPTHHRLYGLVFVGTNPESLASLMSYGKTFRG